MSLMTDAAWKICQKWGGHWTEHPDFSESDWQYEVTNNDTREGYWNWVSNKIMQNKKETA